MHRRVPFYHQRLLDSTAEMEVNTQFTTLEQCNEEGAALAKKLNATDLKVMQVQCERD
ncbi:hypothetical protein [Vibrio lentus]|uniref:hypothetical protein n=1 Tax=Vibrio lentus TaxID=136468 RepID=UPI00130008BE|nr:hypothetical protein [Vibrio lentus]